MITRLTALGVWTKTYLLRNRVLKNYIIYIYIYEQSYLEFSVVVTKV